MTALVVIPARGGSKGIPRKNLLSVGRRPLIAWTIAQALEAQQDDDVIVAVSTEDAEIAEVAAAHGLTPAEVMLRWGLQQGRSVIPKSVRPERIAENLDVFRVALSDEELARIDALETGERGGPDPDAITLETFGREIPEA